MTPAERELLAQLDAKDRAGCVLTGLERGRLADLRRAEILETVLSLLPPVTPAIHDREVR